MCLNGEKFSFGEEQNMRFWVCSALTALLSIFMSESAFAETIPRTVQETEEQETRTLKDRCWRLSDHNQSREIRFNKNQTISLSKDSNRLMKLAGTKDADSSHWSQQGKTVQFSLDGVSYEGKYVSRRDRVAVCRWSGIASKQCNKSDKKNTFNWSAYDATPKDGPIPDDQPELPGVYLHSSHGLTN